MWVDGSITQAEKVFVLKLEAEQRKLRSALLSMAATTRKVTERDARTHQYLHIAITDQMMNLFFMMSMWIIYGIVLAMVVE